MAITVNPETGRIEFGIVGDATHDAISIDLASQFGASEDFNDDFSIDKFTNGGGTKFTVNTATEVFDYNNDMDGVSDWEYVDLESLIGEPVDDVNWVLRFETKVDNFVARTTNSAQVILGLFADTSSPVSVQDGFAFRWRISGTPDYDVSSWDGTTGSGSPNRIVFTRLPIIGDDLFWELSRISSTQLKLSVFSDSEYTALIETNTLTVPNHLNLRYLKIGDTGESDATSIASGNFDNIQFWNGITVPVITSTNWRLRYKLDMTAIATTSGSQSSMFTGLSDQDGLIGSNVAQDGYFLRSIVSTSPNLHHVLTPDNQAPRVAPIDAVMATVPAVATFFVEMKRDSASQTTFNFYTDETYTSILDTETQAGVSGSDNLKYFKVMNDQLANNGVNTIDGSIDDITFTDLSVGAGLQVTVQVDALIKSLGVNGCNTPTFFDDFTVNSGWVPVTNDVGGVSITGGQLQGWGADGGVTREIAYDLPTNDGVTISDTKWVAEFDFQYDVPSTSTNPGHTPFTLSDSHLTSTNPFRTAPPIPSVPHPRSISMGVANFNAFNIDRGVEIQVKDTTTTATSSVGKTLLAGIIDLDAFANTTVYPRLERLTATTYRLSVFTDSARTIHVTGTASGADSPVTLTTALSVTSTNFIHSSNSSAGGLARVLDGFIDNLLISSGSGCPEPQVDAILEQTFLACNQPVFSDDFATSTNWVATGTGVSITGGVISGWGLDDADRRLTHDLVTPLVDSWTAEFEYMFTASVTPGHAPFMMADKDQDIDSGTNDNDFIGIFHNNEPTNDLKILAGDNVDAGAGLQSSAIAILASTQYFIRLERVSPTLVRLSVFSDSGFTTHIANSPKTLTIPSTIQNLRYVHSQNLSGGANTRSLTGTLDNLNITGGVCPTSEVDAILVDQKLSPSWQFREHRFYGLFASSMFITKEVASPNRLDMRASPTSGRGKGYVFKVFEKSLVTGSDLSVTLERTQPNVAGTFIEVLDGSYDAKSLIDFVNSGGRLSKGIGVLASQIVLQGAEATVTIPSGSINYAGSTETHITVFITHDDNDTGSGGSTFIRDVFYNGVCWIFDNNFTSSPTVDITIETGGRTNNILPDIVGSCVRFSVGAFLAPYACSPWKHFDDQDTSTTMSFNFTYDDIAHEIPPVSMVTFVTGIKCHLASNSFQGSASMAIMPFPEPVDVGNASFSAVEGKQSNSIAMSSLGGSLSTRTFTFSDPVRLEPGVRYGIRFVDNINNSPGLTIGCFLNTTIPPTNRSNIIWRDPKPGTPARYIDVLGISDRQFAVDIQVLNEKQVVCFLVGAILKGKTDPVSGFTKDWGYREQRRADNFNTPPGNSFFDEPIRANITSSTGGIGQGYFLKTFKKSDITGSAITITWEGDFGGGGSGNQVKVFDGAYDRRENGDFNPTNSNAPEPKGAGTLGTLNISAIGSEVTDVLSAGSINYAGSTEDDITIMVQVNDNFNGGSRNTKVRTLRIGSSVEYNFENSVFVVEESGTNHDHGFLHVSSALPASVIHEFTVDACVGLFGGFSRSRIGDIIIICLRLFPLSTGLEVVQHVNDYTQANGLPFVGKTSRVKNWLGFLENEGLIEEDGSDPAWYKTRWSSLI